ncbi:hypothetical protein E2C01_015143 [Portunus trituberculatus]|uniref:Uncharacterized protein n=1 Tax=Portunus trituberculatus TaxID=210409 RepID=A0A5B7DMC8_PORTR|nr:hypothetical protein [Portunus trituberculatus]
MIVSVPSGGVVSVAVRLRSRSDTPRTHHHAQRLDRGTRGSKTYNTRTETSLPPLVTESDGSLTRLVIRRQTHHSTAPVTPAPRPYEA